MTTHDELLNLANLYCEEAITDEQLERLQVLLRTDVNCQSLFIDMLQLHGQLLWGGGIPPGHQIDEFGESIAEPEELELTEALRRAIPEARRSTGALRAKGSRRIAIAASLMVSVLAVLLLVFRQNHFPAPISVASNGTDTLDPTSVSETNISINNTSPLEDVVPVPPLKLDGIAQTQPPRPDGNAVASVPVQTSEHTVADLKDADVVEEIDRLIRTAWEDNKIQPAAEAGDHEWVRRAYLTLTGRIPTIEQASEYIAASSPRKRDQLVDSLLANSLTAENLAVNWTNLLIGRSNPRDVDEQSLYSFLLEQFAENRPWMETVGQLIAAEGRSDENGATNFLLAHLNDQATPATAVTARLFLGQQVHCTQCHDHPFAKERSQQEFWSLNAFFKQAERKRIPVTANAESGMNQHVWMLTDSGESGMTFYDTLRGQKKAVPPQFAGEALPADGTTSRRAELVRLLNVDGNHQVARAMVNRTWAQFFGYGFTAPVDDLGPHNPVSHPELFDYLTNAFVQSGYDMRRLMRWMTLSQAFRLSSVQSEEALAVDDPQEGGTPLFSRAYPRQMGPEQVYDSIRIAIRSVSQQPIDSSVGTAHRKEWVEQFVRSYGTDENDEQLTFDGNISQALLMMNGEDIENAIPLAAGEVTRSLQDRTVSEAPERLAMATLNRSATENEEKAFRNRYRALSRSLPNEQAMKTATEDMLWAYLNSSEFVSLH
jgi:hypothetical protein